MTIYECELCGCVSVTRTCSTCVPHGDIAPIGPRCGGPPSHQMTHGAIEDDYGDESGPDDVHEEPQQGVVMTDGTFRDDKRHNGRLMR